MSRHVASMGRPLVPRLALDFLRLVRLHQNAFLVLSAMLLAALLGFYSLGNKSVWLDEAFSLGVTTADPSVQIDLFAEREANQLPYFLLLDLWSNISPHDSEFALRSLSVVLAVAALPFIYGIGARLFSPRVGVIAAWLMVINSFFIQYAQEIRGYALVLLVASISSYLFIRLVLDGGPVRRWVLYALVSGLAVYAHFFSVFLITAHMLSLLFLPRREVPWRRVLLALAIIGVLLIPLALYATNVSGPNPLDWIRHPSLRDLARVYVRFSGGREAVGVYFLLAGFASLFALRTWLKSGLSRETWPYAFAFCWVLAGPVLAFVLSYVVRPLLEIRYLMMCFPPLILLVAAGLASLRRPWQTLAAVAVVVVSVFGLYVWYSDPGNEDWRSAAAYVLSKSEPDDAIMFYAPATRLAFDYYAEQSPLEKNEPEYVSYAFAPSRPEFDDHPLFRVGGRLPEPDPHLADRVSAEYGRVWLVLSHDEQNYPEELRRRVQRDRILALLDEDYRLARESEFEGIRILLFVRDAGSTG